MILITSIICVLAVYAQGTAIPAVSRFHLVEPYITGGRPISIGVAPFQVSLQERGKHYCGGSIVSRYHVLTAAHCVMDATQTKDLVIHSRSNFFDKGDKHTVVQRFRHKLFNIWTMDYDVAVLKVAEPFTVIFNERRPVMIVDVGEVTADNTTIVASGWGATELFGEPSEKLMSVELKVANRDTCAEAYTHTVPSMNITTRMMCAGPADQTSDKDVCSGDAGGPIVSRESGKQVGIISWGFACGRGPEDPSVYVNLADKEIHDFVSEALKN